MKLKLSCIIFFAFIVASCGRKTNADENDMEEEVATVSENDTSTITVEEPFRNQPNDLCTIIRKLNISEYSPQTVIADPSQYPKKYCLLDICLEKIDEGAMTLSLSEGDETVTTTFKLIKTFDSYDEAKGYADKFGIKDVKWEE